MACSINGGQSEQKKDIQVKVQIFKDSIYLNSNDGLVYKNDQPFTGKKIQYYNDITPSEVRNYKEGISDGYHHKFFRNGKLSYQAFYENGVLSDTLTSWWSNGNLRSKYIFVDGHREGQQLEYYQSGKLFKKRNMNKGIEHGIQQSWRENGKLYNNYEARNGRIYGLKRSTLCYNVKDEEVDYGNP